MVESNACAALEVASEAPPFLAAASLGQWEVCQETLKKQPACLEVCQVLVSAGADIEATDFHDKTPLAYAAAAHHTEIATLLLDHGAEVEATDCIVRDAGCTVL
ncbi:unnamed protein product [Durusdinium trenchii]|uniref:Uncharacterized protein n=1 Tax=Durusdinium trenchii TaxID=1381693 RepID=A0ABP0JE81_9DINO